MSKGRRSAQSPRFLATRCLSWIAAALVVCGLAAAARAAPTEWPQRTVRIITGPLAPGSSIGATAIGMAAHGTTPAEFAAILDEQRAKWAAIAHDHSIKPVH
jgi:tripartite-type tricarboxylate transporter receptor subunit TctC